MNPRPPRQNTEAELDAFDSTCVRLSGFNPAISFEWVDGFLASLAAAPRVPPADEWLPALCGDAFERAFADPDDHECASNDLRAFGARTSGSMGGCCGRNPRSRSNAEQMQLFGSELAHGHRRCRWFTQYRVG